MKSSSTRLPRTPSGLRPASGCLLILLVAASLLLLTPAPVAAQSVIQTNYGTGDGTVPGPYGVSNTDLLQTSLATPATYAGGTFYRFGDPEYESYLTLLTNGTFGEPGGVPSASVLPDNTTLTFWLDTTASPAGYTLSSIRTYAGWNSGRDGQQYTVKYSLVGAPNDFITLTTTSRFDNTNFPTSIENRFNFDTFQYEDVVVTDTSESSTLIELTTLDGPLATGVAGLRFEFGNVENGGTGFREFDVIGSATTAVPEPSTYTMITGALALGAALIRRRSGRR